MGTCQVPGEWPVNYFSRFTDFSTLHMQISAYFLDPNIVSRHLTFKREFNDLEFKSRYNKFILDSFGIIDFLNV